MAYFLKRIHFWYPYECVHANPADKLVLNHCTFHHTKLLLCEDDGFPATNDGSQHGLSGRRGIQLPKPTNSSLPFPHVTCPSGHRTHEFLACDVMSRCWQHDNVRQSSERDPRRNVTSQCQSLLSTLFTCRTTAELVPYSLVCDHHQDCLDASDEYFCVHPMCSGTQHFECSNKQVSDTITKDGGSAQPMVRVHMLHSPLM